MVDGDSSKVTSRPYYYGSTQANGGIDSDTRESTGVGSDRAIKPISLYLI